MKKMTEDYDHFIQRLDVKLKSGSASIATLEMSAAKEIADPLKENFGAHKDIAALQATMEEKSKAFVTNLHTELMVAVRNPLSKYDACLASGMLAICTTVALAY